jgi:hypothetical protein
MPWRRWEGATSPCMPAAEREAAIIAFLTKVVTNNPPSARIALKNFLIDVARVVEIERNDIDQSGIDFDPAERFALKRRIHSNMLAAGVIRNIRLAREEYEGTYLEVWEEE